MKKELHAQYNNSSESNNTIQYADTNLELLRLDHFKLLDINKALIYLDNDTNLLHKALISIVTEEIPRDLVDLESAYAMGDWHAIEKRAHRLKSGLVYCGVIKLSYACQYFERYYNTGHISLLHPLYQQLITVIAETTAAINQWLSMQHENACV